MNPDGPGGEKVLVAAADGELRETLRAALEGEDYQVLEADDGQLAQRLVSNGQVDVALVDLRLPTVDAPTLLERARAGGWGGPIAIISDESSMVECAGAMRLGAVNILLTPITPDSVTGVVAGALVTGRHTPQPRDEAPADKPVRAETQAVLDDVREQLARGQLNLPMSPWILRELEQLTRSPRRMVHKVAEVVEKDTELAMNVIRRSNAAAYKGFAEVTNLPNAIVRLGERAILSIAMQTMGDRVCRTIHDPGISTLAVQLWRRSVIVAMAARLVAKRLGVRPPEDYYLLALLVEVGEPFLLRVLDDILRSRDEAADPDRVRRQVVAYHPGIGAVLLKRWEMTGDSVVAAMSHHDSDKVVELLEGKPELGKRLYGLALARLVATQVGLPAEFHPTEVAGLTQRRCLKALRLGADDFERTVEELTVEVAAERAGRGV